MGFPVVGVLDEHAVPKSTATASLGLSSSRTDVCISVRVPSGPDLVVVAWVRVEGKDSWRRRSLEAMQRVHVGGYL